MVFKIRLMITNQSKHNTQKLAGDGHQSLHLFHPVLKMPLVMLMHDSAFAHRTKRGVKQQLPHEGASPLGDVPSTLPLAGTDLVEIQPRTLQQLGDRAEGIEISDLADQASHSYRADSLHGKQESAVGNLFQKTGYLLLHLLDKPVALLNGGQKRLDLKGQTDPCMLLITNPYIFV
jgi:hypothetical protein